MPQLKVRGHFLIVDTGGLAQAEDRRQLPGSRVDLAGKRAGENAWDIFQQTATGDMRQR